MHLNNRYKYNNQQSKYKKGSEGQAVSNRCTFCKIIDPNTDQIESREHLYLKCDSSVKVLKEASEAMGIEVNDLKTKGYEILIYKKKENVWEETRENPSYCCTGSISLSAELGKDYLHEHIQAGTKTGNIYDY